MDHKLQEEEIDQICITLQSIEVLNEYKDVIGHHPEFIKESFKLNTLAKTLMSPLTKKQRINVMKIHKTKFAALKKEIAEAEKFQHNPETMN